ncbi:MAG: SAM-dependent methyltransferase [Sulfolobales archaeon]|nr:SAM-dependent methyltransferase [Sulfolobales archaeon]MDW8083569.1 SAM-dependent methyltransferase [Sulfolobales archaeon]
MRVVVEHLEECLSPWLMSEYSYVVKLFGEKVVFTNVRSSQIRDALRRLGASTTELSIVDLVTVGEVVNPIVLDPKARETLQPEDLEKADAVVIGGIMGEHPPRGRTYREITSRLAQRALSRNIGKYQLTIAGAAYVLKRVSEGYRLELLDIRFGLRFTTTVGGYEITVELPYAFPYEGAKPVLPEDYLEIIARKSLLYESKPACVEE